ncbi:MAG: aminopeptidase P N-terminal domain-containing protein [Gemmatimonadota bacterium]|nr:MAG: aminopeptidase P N-terminal domain-containing protein [Gemmatimonadota bacterium]
MPNSLVLRRAILWTAVLLICTLPPQPVSATGAAAAVAEPDSGHLPPKVLEQRRAALLDLLEPGIVLLRSAEPRDFYDHPQDSDFRQDNNFYYLTGLETPGSWLVMFKPQAGKGKVMLYIPERDPVEETWSGPRLGPGEQAARRTGIGEVRSAAQFETEVLGRLRVSEAFREYPQVYLALAEWERMREFVELALSAGRSIADVSRPLAELRLRKDSAEVARLRRAIDITAEAQREAMKAARPGMHEYELEAVVEYVFRSRGAERVGFPTIVGSGPNTVVLHYDKNRRRTEEGDLVVIDAGAEYGYYSADVTRTFPVSGEFTSRQRAIYELVLATQKAVIDSVRPGIAVWELGRIARRFMSDNSRGLCGLTGCDRYFVHGFSHWLGMDVHDVGDYARPLEPGMVLTVEPGIYLPEENLGVRIEDDLLVTEDGHEVLSAKAPKTIEEIEALMRQDSCLLQCR